jgi:hypothetical protein
MRQGTDISLLGKVSCIRDNGKIFCIADKLGVEIMKTTLNKIRDCSPCESGWGKLLKHLEKTEADDEELSLLTILESNGLDDALWCLQAVDGCGRDARLYAVWCARRVQHLMTDERSINALDVAERFANGEASQGELDAARPAASAAAWAAAMAAASAAASAAAWAAARNAQKDMFIKMCNGEAPWQTGEIK